jgi:hypothetical protein
MKARKDHLANRVLLGQQEERAKKVVMDGLAIAAPRDHLVPMEEEVLKVILVQLALLVQLDQWVMTACVVLKEILVPEEYKA